MEEEENRGELIVINTIGDSMKDVMKKFLAEDEYVDYTDIMIVRETSQATIGCKTEEDKIKAIFEFVRDEISNAYAIDALTIPYTASMVVKARLGTDDSKAVLFAAMLRSIGIPTGFCYQRLTVVDDDSEGHYLHCYNAVFFDGKWIKLDASANPNGKLGGFCKITPELSFEPREVYDERNIPGIWAKPFEKSMKALKDAEYIAEVPFSLPDEIDTKPDINE